MSLIFIEDVIILSGHTSILLFCSYFTKKEIVNLYASFQFYLNYLNNLNKKLINLRFITFNFLWAVGP